MSLNDRLMTNVQRDVIVNLYLSDQQTRGQATLRPDEMPIARDWLPQLLTDSDKLAEHVTLLAGLYRGAFCPPAPRRERLEGKHSAEPRPVGFIHCELLPADRASSVAQQGPDALTDVELASLLLNPFALYDLADLIRTELPDWWIDALVEAGRNLIRRHGLVIELPDLPESGRTMASSSRIRDRVMRPTGPCNLAEQGKAWVIGFAEDALPLKRQIAERLTGDANSDFTLILHWRTPTAGGDCVAELEVSPAPSKESVTLMIDIKGHTRTFTLEVPASVRLDPEADVPERAFARAAEAVPAAPFDLKEAEWGDDWPPSLVLRCRAAAGS